VEPVTGLALRWASSFALLAAAIVLPIGWGVTLVVQRSLEQQTVQVVERQLDLVEPAVERIGSEVLAALGEVEARLRADPAVVARLARGGPDVVDEASRLAGDRDLGLLDIVSRGGIVLSSKHWPELAGLERPPLEGPIAREPLLRRVRGPQGNRLAVVGSRLLDDVEEPLTLVAGRFLDERFAAAIAPGHATAVFDLDEGGAEALLVGATLPGRLVEWGAWARSDDDDLPHPRDPKGLSWVAGRRLLLDDAGRSQAVVVVATPHTFGLPGSLRLLLVAGGALAVVMAALSGAWMARRVSRPVERLVRAVDAIAAGEADYAFPGRAEHELDRLAEAFSRLQRSLEGQQRRSVAAERVAAWREVARRVAHEVKNPLVPIRLTVENLLRARRNGSDAFDSLFDEGARTILEEVEQLRGLVTEFSEFARLPAPRPRPVELHEIVDGVLELHAAEPGLEIVRSYGAGRLRISVDPEQIGRALKNVVGNAVEAMREVGGPSRLEVRTALEGGMFEIEVSDNGPGIPQETQGRIFEPYVTSKPQGTGLGMAIAYRIVVEHGGELEAVDRPGGGATIRFRVPAGPRVENEANE
jgi:signal transduction histidine kinase